MQGCWVHACQALALAFQPPLMIRALKTQARYVQVVFSEISPEVICRNSVRFTWYQRKHLSVNSNFVRVGGTGERLESRADNRASELVRLN